jgi:tetratricopeptide (TPR) repeat protein
MQTCSRHSWALIAAVATALMSVGVQAFPQPPATAAALRARGLQLGYNLDHADALAAFKEAVAADPRDPAGYRLAAATAWITLLFEQGAITVDDFLGQARANLPRRTPNAALAAVFRDNVRQALALSEQQLEERPGDANAHYEVGAALGLIASYNATVEGHLLGSVGAARRAYREHERAAELDAQHKDADLIVGLYRYTVATLPAPLRLLSNLVGFGTGGGGRDGALRLVEDAARYPSDVQPNAMFTLILLYNREARYDDALRVIRDLQRTFPRNRLLWLEAGSTALRAGRPIQAKAMLEEGLARLSLDARPRAFGENARWRYAHGAALAALKEIAPAEQELRAALTDPARDWLKGRIHKELGKLADLSGDRPRALDEYRAADRLCRRDDDSQCADDAQTLMRHRFYN